MIGSSSMWVKPICFTYSTSVRASSRYERLSPFGTGNERPVFLIKGATVDGVKQFGKEGNHTEITFLDRKGRKLTAIQFFLTKDMLPKHVVPQAIIDVAVHLEKSMFKSYPELRLRIVDIL